METQKQERDGSMKTIISITGAIAMVVSLSLSVVVQAQDPPPAGAAKVTIAWDANTEAHLGGYKLYWSDKNVKPFDNVQDAGKKTQATIENLEVGKTYFFAATAYDNTAKKNESQYSDILEYKIPTDPMVIKIPDKPTEIRILFGN